MTDTPDVKHLTTPSRVTDGGNVASGVSVVRVEIAGTTVWQVIGAILLTLVLLSAARAASGLLAMVGLSFFFSLAMDPAVRWSHARYGWRRGRAVGAIYLAGLAVITLLVFILFPAIGQLATRIAWSGGEWIAQLNAWPARRWDSPSTTVWPTAWSAPANGLRSSPPTRSGALRASRRVGSAWCSISRQSRCSPSTSPQMRRGLTAPS